ncbi:hypothetical protein B0H13DRAFT_1886056 [Mycena leptocephala]|nr:hypothetical protein B0H13DRAFT_1886056 [Mycena leptocephala]
MAERPYIKSDFVGLIVMIERQAEKFPKGLNLSKINIPDMQKVLLDPQIGFTTNLPGEQQTSPTPWLEDTTPYIQPDVQNVQPRIRDRRSESNQFNVIQRVNINLVDNVDCRDNEWRASSIEIFKELQASIGQLDGRIVVPDSEEPEYTEYFVTFNVKDKTETFSQNLSNIIIPDGNKLALRVDPKTSWPTEISSTTQWKRPSAFQSRRSTDMTRIITIYKCDGPNRSAEVIAEVTGIQQADALGASALKSFLQSWANGHPVVDN